MSKIGTIKRTLVVLGFYILFHVASTIKAVESCGKRTLVCECQQMEATSITMNIIQCQTNISTCEPCDGISDSDKCQMYCNQTTVQNNTINNVNYRMPPICRCENGGKCKEIGRMDTTCICPKGFHGQFCEFRNEIEIINDPNQKSQCNIAQGLLNGIIIKETETVYAGEYIKYNCSVGYALIGNATRYCMENGMFSGTEPTCEKVCTIPVTKNIKLNYIVNPNHKNQNQMFDQYGIVLITELEFYCEDDFKIEGPTRIRCIDGAWDNEPPRCVWTGISCPTPKSLPPNLIQKPAPIGSSAAPGSIFSYQCINGASMVGDPLSVCTYSGTWFPQPPTCILPQVDAPLDVTSSSQNAVTPPLILPEITCPLPTDLPHGMFRISLLPTDIMKYLNLSKVPTRTIAYYSCYKPYKLKGLDTRECLANGEWNGKDPICVPECGKVTEPLRLTIINGVSLEIRKWPWQVGLYERKYGNLICGGTVISEVWVLTAAHCVTTVNDGQLITLLPEKFSVFLGETTSSPDLKSPNVITREVTDIRPHQNYQHYISDSDIALILLKSPVTFNDNIRPVCLPSTTSSLTDIPNSVGTVAGWGETNASDSNTRVPKSSLELKYIQVKVASNQDCINTFNAVNNNGFAAMITPNMFCAGNEGVGTCFGDSGGSLCMATGPQDDVKYQIEGIVSWGSNRGCAEAQYDVYTRVRNFVDWINHYVGEDISSD